MGEVIVVIGAGQIGQAIAHRVNGQTLYVTEGPPAVKCLSR
jgi:predicted dinucleotide-binding enzyme